MKLLFATNNKHKFREINDIIPKSITLISLADAGINEEVPETGETLEENALIKARAIFNKTGIPAFADDTGLEIEVLKGEPGVRSARYAGENKNMNENIEKVLNLLEGKSNRKARFRTVIALVTNHSEHTFEGIAEGLIINEKRGTSGFGYDPIFIPAGSRLTFAEMSSEAKSRISHRSAAVVKFVAFINRSTLMQ